MRMTAKEAIELLQTTYGNALDEDLVITWWDSTDFKDKEENAPQVADDQLEICIGHVNDIVGEFASEEEESDLCEMCESNEKETEEGKWCTSCRDDFKESESE